MNLTGGRHIEGELLPARRFPARRRPSLRITIEFETAYEAAIAYDDFSRALATGVMVLSIFAGQKIEEKP